MRAGRGAPHARRASPLRVAVAFLGLCGLFIAWSLVRASQFQYDAHRALACRHGAQGCANLTRLAVEYLPAGKPIFTFRVCNGLTNQRIGLITGLCIAKLLDRDVLLPHVILRDTPQSPRTVPLSRLYDLAFLRAQLPAMVLFEDPARAQWSVTHRVERAMNPSAFYLDLAQRSARTTLLGFDCTLFALDFRNDEALVAHAWHVHRALRFVAIYTELAGKVLQYLRARTAFLTVVHGRFERDWQEHCVRWKHGFNCMSSAEEMLHAVRTHSHSKTVYVAQAYGRPLLPYAALATAGYELVAMADVFPTLAGIGGRGGGVELAAVDFLVGEAADLYIGNSVSTFSALQILARRDAARAAALTNGGGVPLARFLPPLSVVRQRLARRLAWVFTFTDTGSSLYHDHLLALVQSAVERTTLRPVCIFTGSMESPTARWLRRNGVALIQHELSFADALSRIDLSKEWRTPLAASLAMVISTFQRVDIPLLAELADEELVLYTDVDVLFVDDVRLAAVPVPDYFACGPEDKPAQWSPCNAGVLLLNVANMRHTHDAFVAYILARPGLKFPQGPLDQGALNGFYQGKITRLPLEYNWKPYWPDSAGAKIVHFHGPKPVDLATYLRNGTVTNRLYKKLLPKCHQGKSCGAHLHQYLQLLERAKRSFLQS